MPVGLRTFARRHMRQQHTHVRLARVGRTARTAGVGVSCVALRSHSPMSLDDPLLPSGSLQSCPMLSDGFSGFASTKQPLVTSSSRPLADLRLAKISPPQRPVRKYSRHRSTVARRCSSSEAVGQGPAALVDTGAGRTSAARPAPNRCCRPTHRSPWRTSERTTDAPTSLTFVDGLVRSLVCGSGPSRVPIDDRDEFATRRLGPNVVD